MASSGGGGQAGSAGHSGTKRPPNVLFLFADDQRYGTLGSRGDTQCLTPHLDALAARGTYFEQCYVQGGNSPAVCAPSRAMMLTGRTLFHVDKQGEFDFHINSAHIQLPEVFRAAGYRTFGTGKQHNGKAAFARAFTDGDAIFFGGMADHFNCQVHGYDPTGVYPDGASSKAAKHTSEAFADAAISFINSVGEQPFFAYVAFTAPHDPFTVPAEFVQQYDVESIALPPNFAPEHPFDQGENLIRELFLDGTTRLKAPFSAQDAKLAIARYYAMITHMDAQIGRILAALEKRGLTDDTLVFFVGDNGLALGQHGYLHKQNLYEHAVRVPAILAGPGVVTSETRSALCHHFDFYPTLCELANVPVPQSCEAKSLVSVLDGRESSVRDSLLYAYMDTQRAIRRDKYKLIEYLLPSGMRKTLLFDIEADPWELQDLANTVEYSSMVSSLREELRSWQALGDTTRFWNSF